MDKLFLFLTGPMAYVAFGIFFGGLLYRVISFLYLSRTKDHEVLTYFSIPYGLRSIFMWSIPFGSRSWRKCPWFILLSYLFHISVFFVPLFLSAHVIMVNMSWRVSWWWLPDYVADIFTLLGLVCCFVFAIRRLVDKGIRYITTFEDWFVLSLVFMVLLSGFCSYHQLINYRISLLTHIFLGEILLISIPFTKLSHMIIFPFLRGYIGSEFGKIRNSRDW